MISNWSNVLTELRAKTESSIGAGSITPYYCEIPEGANLNDSADLYMTQGFVWELNEADLAGDNFNNLRVQQRSLSLIITREININSTNTSGFATLKTEMLAHAELVRLQIAGDRQLNQKAIDAYWISDSGINEITDPNPENPGARYYVLASEYLVKIEVSDC
jgi:hypothetical protein